MNATEARQIINKVKARKADMLEAAYKEYERTSLEGVGECVMEGKDEFSVGATTMNSFAERLCTHLRGILGYDAKVVDGGPVDRDHWINVKVP